MVKRLYNRAGRRIIFGIRISMVFVISMRILWNKILNNLRTKRAKVISLLAFVVMIFAVIQGISFLIDKFGEGEVVFKTTRISPNIEEAEYDLCIVPGGNIIPIAKSGKMISGLGDSNIDFTLTNNTKQELLIDKIEAVLVDYEKIPDKCIVTMYLGGGAQLIPIELLLDLDPSREVWDMLGDEYISIDSGKTEHVFRIEVGGSENWIYTFRIDVTYRIKGNIEKVIKSDKTYRFAVPDYDKVALCTFLYKADKNDPYFKEILDIVEEPLDEFNNITSRWGDLKIFDSLIHAPENLKYFVSNNIYVGSNGLGKKESGNPFDKEASEIILTESDVRTAWRSYKDNSELKVTMEREDLPEWFLEKYKNESKAISAKTIKIVVETELMPVIIYNTVAVYDSIQSAKIAFNASLPENKNDYTYKEVSIGDECYLFLSEVDFMMYRKGNVVSAIIEQFNLFPMEKYAEIIEAKILS